MTSTMKKICKEIHFPISKKVKILSLGAESVGMFCFYENGSISISEDFGDILNEENFKRFRKCIMSQVKRRKPDVIITDLHPLYNSTVLGEEISKKMKIPRIQIQHHIAHIFSSFGDWILENDKKTKSAEKSEIEIPREFFGIASDGTGFGFDGNIWGGEIFQIRPCENCKKEASKTSKRNECEKYAIDRQLKCVKRIGSLEEHTMIGSDLAVREPARMLISIFAKILNKEKLFFLVKKYYNRNEFELIYNQMLYNFNCQKTTSTGRVLDTVSLLLGFAQNKRNYKHEAASALDAISRPLYSPYRDIEVKIQDQSGRKTVSTTHLFKYLTTNIKRNKKRLAATAQTYLAKGFYKVLRKTSNENCQKRLVFFSGGISSNKTMSSYLERKKIYISKNTPRGDEGISFGQIVADLYLELHCF